MTQYKIAWLPGDGVGIEVSEAARIVLQALQLDAELIPGDIGWEFWCKEGNPLPERTLKLLENTDCCFFGAITSKPKDEAIRDLAPELRKKNLNYFSPIVRIRQLFNLYTNMRPCKAYAGNPLNYRDDIDLVVFRENTEGLYSGVEFHPVSPALRQTLEYENANMKRFHHVDGKDLAISCRIFSRTGCQRILRSAMRYAQSFNKKSVTVVEKPNVIRETSGLMLQEARKMISQYPDIELWEVNVDAMVMWLVKNPELYSVIATSNLFGDIISDLCAQLVGGLGFAASANIGDNFALFEPTHGSAPKYAGQYKVNPIASLISTRLMLEYLGENSKAKTLEDAIEKTIREGKIRTYDIGGTASTLDVAHEIAGFIRQ